MGSACNKPPLVAVTLTLLHSLESYLQCFLQQMNEYVAGCEAPTSDYLGQWLFLGLPRSGSSDCSHVLPKQPGSRLAMGGALEIQVDDGKRDQVVSCFFMTYAVFASGLYVRARCQKVTNHPATGLCMT